jgi:DsbC/DsbD-like thiol-disulfide interchange protein
MHRISYPVGVPLRSAFARKELSVYQGSVQLVAKLGAVQVSKQAPISGVVTLQACNERLCLPPAAVPITVPN